MEKRNGGRSMNSYKVAGMKIGIVPKYNPITQKEYCSVPAVLQMIQERRGLRLFTQDLIGHHLGLVVPADKAHLYRIVRTGMEPETGWGTQIYKSEYSINAYFGRAGLPLKHITPVRLMMSQSSLLRTSPKTMMLESASTAGCYTVTAMLSICL
jgi:hypothetical protein